MAKLLNCYGATKVFLFLTTLLAPLYVVRFHIGPYPSTLLEVLVGLTVGAWLGEKIREKGIKGLKGVKGINVPTVLLLAAAAISVIVSPDRRGALGIFKAYFVEPILIYLVIKDIVKSKRDWWLFLGALGLSGLWVALLAVFQGLTGWLTITPHEATLGRAHAVYDTANAVGLYLGPIVFLSLGGLRGIKRIKGIKEVAAVGGVGLLVLAILLSKSTGAAVGLAAAALVPIAYCLLPRKWVMGVIGVIGGIGVIAGTWFFFNISKFTPRDADPYVRKSADTLQFRVCLWEGTRNLLLDHPVFGAGLSGFKELYAQRYFTCDAEPLEYPHNWMLNIWAELGALGLVAFLWILWRYFKSVKDASAYSLVPSASCLLPIAFLAAMVYWLVHGLADVPYFKNDLALEFWVVVGLLETLQLKDYKS